MTRVSVKHEVETVCPYTDTLDISRVTVEWEAGFTRPIARVDARQLRHLVDGHESEKVSAEDLACAVAGEAWEVLKQPVRVVVTQMIGHGVEAEAWRV